MPRSTLTDSRDNIGVKVKGKMGQEEGSKCRKNSHNKGFREGLFRGSVFRGGVSVDSVNEISFYMS